jgi:hypothetical protein
MKQGLRAQDLARLGVPVAALCSFRPNGCIAPGKCEKYERSVTIMPEIHVHIPAGLAVDQVIHIHLLGDDEPAPDVSAQPEHDEYDECGDDSTVEGMLAILEAKRSASPRLRADLRAFQEIGYEMDVPKLQNGRLGAREPYISLRDPAVPGHDAGAGYVRAGWLHLTRKSDRDKLARLPDARITGSYAKFPLDGVSDLRAARLVKR